jgi:MFS transporter, DHA2 family, multidrug resistance protein
MTTGVQSARAGRREWIGLAVIALPCLLYAMDLTVLNLALPRLSAELQPSSVQLLWIVDIYGFFVAGMLITMGNLGDRIGRRRLLLIGAAAFGVASVLAAFSRTAGMLIAARALLGIAGATLAPSTLSLIRNMFLDPRQRTVAIGVWITSYSVGGAIGPLLGGVMLQHFWWGSVFLLAVPVMALLLVVGPVLLPEFRAETARKLDLPSAALSLVAVLSVIYGVKVFAQDGLGWLPALSVLGGIAVALVFGRRQRKLADPLIDLRLFRAPAFSASLATYLLGTLVSFGSYVFIGQYLQLVLGLTPLSAGIWTLPWSGGFIVGSMLAPPISRRIRPAFVMAAGLAFAAVGFAVLTQLAAWGLPGFVIGSIIFSVGLAPLFTLGTDLIVGAAPPEGAGAAAAISETSSELGGALGIAILGSVGTAIYRAAMATAALDGVPPEARQAARDTLGGASAEAARLAGPAGAQLLETARSAFGQAMRFTALVCAIVSALAAVLVVVMLRRVRTPAAAADGDVADRIRPRNRKRSAGVAASDPSDCRDGDGCYLPLRPATDIDNPIRRTT